LVFSALSAPYALTSAERDKLPNFGTEYHRSLFGIFLAARRSIDNHLAAA